MVSHNNARNSIWSDTRRSSSLDLYNGTSLEATALEPIKEDALMLFQPESSSSATMASRHHSGRSLPTSSWDEPNSKARLTSLSRTNPNFEDAPIDSDSDDDRGDGDASDTTSDEHISDTALRTKASARLPSSFQVAPDYSDSEGERDMDAEGDMDAEYHSAFDAACTISESDSDDEDDKDYDPRGASSSKGKTAPTTPPRRTSTIHSHRFSPYRSPNTTPSRAGSAPTSPTPSNASPARLRVFPTRVEQVSSSMPAPSPSDLHPSPNPRDSDRPWECDHCDYASKRRSELARHTRAHLQGEREAEHACWGVPVEQAAEFGITDLRDAMVFNGELRVGGCWKRFSRRDAVLRHLKAKNNYCVCDIYPAKVLKAR